MSYLRRRPGLLDRFRRGDREALAEVYRAYLQRITLVLRRGFVLAKAGVTVPGCANPDDLAEALQEVFARAFDREARESYDAQRDYAPYLVTIARNVIISRYRRSDRERLGVDAESLIESDINESSPDEAAAWLNARSLEITRAYLASLEEPLRALHAARYVQALSQRDTARQLGLSRSKVRNMDEKLRRELRNLLIQQSPHERSETSLRS
jgi:RNA polymerase sigma factor (sigma-70 family)